MTVTSWLQLAALLLALGIGTRYLGAYLAKVFGGGAAPGDRVFSPIERVVYRAGGIDPGREQPWSVYAISVLAFSLVSVLVVYLVQRLQVWLPLNPNGADNVAPALSFNTAVSFVTNTNWQNYSGESTMSYLTQAGSLTVQNFVSAAVGLSVAVALIRGLVRARSATIGNFWGDLTRGTIRVLLPFSLVAATVLLSQGVVQNVTATRATTTVEGATQVLPGGLMASQEAIKELGTNGGGYVNANSAHPFENPNGFTNWFEILLILLIPFALTYTFGRLAKNQRMGWVVFASMFILWAASAAVAIGFESAGNDQIAHVGADQAITADQSGGNTEGKEVRFGPVGSALFAASTTGTSTGAVNSTHDSYTPLGGATPLVNIMLGEVSPGGVGAGLYGMLIFVLLAVFIAGLMVGRTPELLGKKIQAAEMKLVVIAILAVPLAVLGFTAASVLLPQALASLLNPGPHGLTEMTYAFTSAANNNGSAFGGLSGNTDWFNTTLGISMLIGRFVLIVAALAIAGSLGRKQPIPASAGTFPTDTPLFAGLIVGVVVILVGLTYFPVLALGPIVEHLGA
jgi:K+-transporting ATPase ATPase A chain